MIPKELKKSIIQYAIEGKLVEQYINEGFAKVLIEDINKTKEQLIKDKVIKKDKFNSYIYRDNNRFFEKNDNGIEDITYQLPFDIPESWEWVRLGNVIDVNRTKKISNGRLPILSVKYMRTKHEPEISDKGFFVNAGDLLLLSYGENTGEIFYLNEPGYLGSTFNKITIFKPNLEKWVVYFINSQFDYIKNRRKGSAIPFLNKEALYDIFIPIPPLNEQKRIVEKIEETFNIIDQIQE